MRQWLNTTTENFFGLPKGKLNPIIKEWDVEGTQCEPHLCEEDCDNSCHIVNKPIKLTHSFDIDRDGKIYGLLCPITGEMENWNRYDEQGHQTGKYVCAGCKEDLNDYLDELEARAMQMQE